MKILFILLICFWSIPNCHSQNWLWAKSGIGSKNDAAYSIISDTKENIFITGEFTSPTLTFGASTLTNNGSYNVFISKYDASGNVLWAKSAGGTGADVGSSVSADGSGNVFVTGYFHSPTITFGSTVLTNAGLQNIFIAKYDASGNVLWAKSAGGIKSDAGYAVSADINGNVFVTGYFSSPAISFGSTTLSNSGGYDLFIAKYDGNGNILWAKSASGIKDDLGSNVSADLDGNVFITGNFGSPSLGFGSSTINNSGNYDLFVAKYDATGNFLWAKSAGGSGNDWGSSISTDEGGNAFVTGGFGSPSINFGYSALINNGTYNIFIAKYDATGNVMWAKSAGGTNNDWGCSVSANAGGNIFVTGGFSSPSLIFGYTMITPPAGSSDPMFIVNYDANGNVICASSLQCGGGNNGVSADRFGNAFIAGNFTANPFIVGSDTLFPGAQNADNIFVTQYNCGNANAVNEKNNAQDVLVYPNPSNGNFTLQVDSHELTANSEIKIYNVFGECIYQQKCKPTNQQMDLSNLPGGIYFLKIFFQDGNSEMKKIIKE